MPDGPSELERVAAEASTCTRCRLHQSRTQVVFGQGSPTADLMFVGEGPGFHEDRQGQPFVGPSGQLLNRLLGEIGLAREDVYITNVVRCLRYNAPVQLADGSWERIGRLVRSRYDGSVMSVDSDGRLVPRRVIGWHASPLAGRRVFRMTYRSANRSAKWAGSRGRVSVELTGDHEVLTDHGYVSVEKLPAGARIATGHGLSEVAYDVVCGTVLGDGHLDARSSHLSLAHGERQREYVRLKAQVLEELDPQVATYQVAAGSGIAYPSVHLRTLAHRSLRALRSDFYRPRKRVPSWMAERLTPRMLAFWFMDDGYTRIRPPRQPGAEIATCGFPEEDLAILIRGLGRLGLTAKAARGRIYFSVPATRALSEVIAPYVPPSMRYKLHPDVSARVAYDPGLLEPGNPLVLYDAVNTEDVTDRPRPDTTFFCIDVEQTHNFVTSGGVVHNCRPPGNRDPQPDEIEACSRWMEATLRLVDPKVIVTLGNFASKTLIGTTTGITRLRGRTYEFEDRVLLPTFHPSAALRADTSGRTENRTLNGMREDFQALARLLAQRRPVPQEAPPPPPEPERGGGAADGRSADQGEQLGLF
jgi:uracil-DNA glycosylase family 4